jgi:hypothetical protein
MTSLSSAMRPWTVCFACGSAIQPDPLWLDRDGLLCRECARRRRIEHVRRNEAVYQRRLRERQAYILPEASHLHPGSSRPTRRPNRSPHS